MRDDDENSINTMPCREKPKVERKKFLIDFFLSLMEGEFKVNIVKVKNAKKGLF